MYAMNEHGLKSENITEVLRLLAVEIAGLADVPVWRIWLWLRRTG